MTRIDISEHLKDQLLSVLMYYLDQDMRRTLAREVPCAYNAITGHQNALVVHHDGRPW